MARASTRTLMPLDTYARLMGINPVHFNGGGPIQLATSVLFPMENASNNIWPQYAYQNHDQVCREELGSEIARAEDEIRKWLKYSPAPDWFEDQVYDLTLHYLPEAGQNYIDSAGYDVGIPLRYGKFIETGRKKSTLLGSVAVAYSDPDTDGFKELATVTIPATTNVDLYTYKVYFSGTLGDDTWEIRPALTKLKVGANIVMTFRSWLFVDPDLWEQFPTDESNGKSIDMTVTANFVANVDVYQVENDPTQPGCVFFSPAAGGGYATQNGYLYQKEGTPNVVVPVAADYNAVTGLWEVADYPTDAQYIRLWYYAGARMTNLNKSYDYLSDSMALAISQLTTARLERPFYANTNATSLAEDLRQDLAMPPQGRFRMMPADLLTNPFGSKEGEWRAWRYVRNFAERVMGCAVI